MVKFITSEETDETPTFLKLSLVKFGDIVIVRGEDGRGNTGSLVAFKPEGKVERCRGLPLEGLKYDREGKVVEVD